MEKKAVDTSWQEFRRKRSLQIPQIPEEVSATKEVAEIPETPAQERKVLRGPIVVVLLAMLVFRRRRTLP